VFAGGLSLATCSCPGAGWLLLVLLSSPYLHICGLQWCDLPWFHPQPQPANSAWISWSTLSVCPEPKCWFHFPPSLWLGPPVSPQESQAHGPHTKLCPLHKLPFCLLRSLPPKAFFVTSSLCSSTCSQPEAIGHASLMGHTSSVPATPSAPAHWFPVSTLMSWLQVRRSHSCLDTTCPPTVHPAHLPWTLTGTSMKVIEKGTVSFVTRDLMTS
jgi:hypothetical protein